MAAKNCEDCGVKLTMLNRHMKYREKCHPCGHKEFVRVKEERERAAPALAQQQPAQQPAKDFTQQQATKSMASPENCEDCGVKLTLGNRNWRYRDKCGPCGTKEYYRRKGKQPPEEAAYVTYLGGFAGVTTQHSVKMRFEATKAIVEDSPLLGKGQVLWVMPYNKIRSTRVDTTENLTAARLLLTGILAFGLKKKHRYLVVSFEDEYGLIQNPVFEGMWMNLAGNKLYERIGAARAAQAQQTQAAKQPQEPQTAPIDVTEQIKKLGELRDQGLLTQQEFDSKKQELLARM